MHVCIKPYYSIGTSAKMDSGQFHFTRPSVSATFPPGLLRRPSSSFPPDRNMGFLRFFTFALLASRAVAQDVSSHSPFQRPPKACTLTFLSSSYSPWTRKTKSTSPNPPTSPSKSPPPSPPPKSSASNSSTAKPPKPSSPSPTKNPTP